MSIQDSRLLSVRYPTLRHLLQLRPRLPGIPVLLKLRLGLMAIIHSNGVPQKKPAKSAGLSLPNVESDLLQGALPIRLEVIGSTWRCIKQKRDVRVLLWGKAPAPDRLRPAEPKHCRVHSWMGCASWRCCRASWSGRRARCGSRRVRARPRSNHGSMRAGRCVRASRSPSGLCRAAHV